ncbi:hypothetical protein LSTR_LSTR003531 [Laodelphax striatellus]|uniref:Uncharacterized protein n=1 Tax=Laodelphax striatellus TaxID=195883 RepID=A0A482WLR8_LAOST|nr:hypothetical protein LSTR_LSTR003531 [Laodelphax striatellus]
MKDRGNREKKKNGKIERCKQEIEREGNLEAVAVRAGALLKYTPPAPVFAALRPAFNINYAEVLIPISVPKRTGLPGEPA